MWRLVIEGKLALADVDRVTLEHVDALNRALDDVAYAEQLRDSKKT